MGVAKFVAALTLGAIALIAVFYISDDNSDFMFEDVVKTGVSGQPTELPEDMDSFVAVAMSNAKKSKFDPFHIYKWTKEEAAKKAPKAAFKAAAKQCKLIRTGSYKKCANFYCAAKKACGDKHSVCEKKFGQPHIQIVPLTDGAGKQFYSVHEVAVKETHNKEVRAKEVGAKEKASKERGKKEKGYKAKVAAEKGKKEVQKKERVTKEKLFKKKQAAERLSKEKTEKKKEKAFKAKVLLKCINRGDKVQVACETKKAAAAQQKAAAAEGKEKAAVKTAEAQKKKEAADAVAYASEAAASYGSSYPSGYTSSNPPPLPQHYASALAAENDIEAADVAAIAGATASATTASNKAAMTETVKAADEASYASESTVAAGYKAKLDAYKSAVIAAGQNPINTQMPPPALDKREQAETNSAMNYANTVIPAGGQINTSPTGSAVPKGTGPGTGSGAGGAAGSAAAVQFVEDVLEDENIERGYADAEDAGIMSADEEEEEGFEEDEEEEEYTVGRRLLSKASAATPKPPAPTPPPAPPTGAPTAFNPKKAAVQVKTLTGTVVKDKKAQQADRNLAAKQVNTTATADQAEANAENTFNTAHADNLDQANRARLHASKAALAESRVSAVDSYVSTHRGKLHQHSCGEEKKFAFDVCFGRAAYKGQLFQTKRAAEARNKADAYKKLMGKDYAVVIETNKTLVTETAKGVEDNKKARAAHKKLNADADELAKLKGAIKQEKATKAEEKASKAKAKAEAEAAAAMAASLSPPPPPPSPIAKAIAATGSGSAAAPAATGSAAAAPVVAAGSAAGSAASVASLVEDEEEEEEDMYGEEDLDEDFEETEDINVGRRLLAKKPSQAACTKTSGKAFKQCKTIVNDAYAACTRIFQKAMGQ